ncbi:universal stress protein [Streptomyces sp. NPDC002588]|uniref:universal stress protein n=1 Tax=Streptomyces sp. NPDC002588 TaxID=3154419 RepID=UPI003330B400
MSGPVLVGVDGSASSLVAVETAAREADRLGVELRLAHAFEWPVTHVPPGVPPWEPGGNGARGHAHGALTEAERRAHRAAPGLRVTHTVLMGEPAAVLETESRGASLTVVGSRPVSRSAGVRRGSVAVRLTAHGDSPVLMVRGRPDPAGPVVLAADHGHLGRPAAEFAFAEASARGTDVVVLNGFETADGRRDGYGDTLAALRQEYPDVTVRRPRVRGGTRRAVVAASAHAQLVVIGTRGRGGFPGTPPTRVSRAALRHADCPVAVIRATEEHPRPVR